MCLYKSLAERYDQRICLFMAVLISRLCSGPSFGAVILRLHLSRFHIRSPSAIRLYTTKLARNKAVYSAPAVSVAQCFSKPVSDSMPWQSLGAPSAELTLDFTLPTGQSFRWRRTGKAEFTGVVDNRVVSCRHLHVPLSQPSSSKNLLQHFSSSVIGFLTPSLDHIGEGAAAGR